MKRIDFYYWGFQCPISYEMLDLLKTYEETIEIRYHDFQNNPELAKALKLFFPFLTVFNDTLRWKGPLKKELLEQFIQDEELYEAPYIIEQGQACYKGEIVELTANTIDLVSSGCTLGNCQQSCKQKGSFLAMAGDAFYGMLNLKNGQVAGGAEFLPSINVPYDVPKDKDTAFLTCIYHSSTEMDYKAYPLAALERKLAERYKQVIAISDELGTFPNGNLKWFEAQGYEDKGVVAVEAGYCKLHLVSKKL